QLIDCRFDPASDVEKFISNIRFHTEEIGSSHISHVNKVVSLRTISKYDWRQLLLNSIEDLHDDADVGSVIIHAWAVNVHVAQSTVRKFMLVVHGPEKLFAGNFGGTVHRAVVERMILGHRCRERISIN